MPSRSGNTKLGCLASIIVLVAAGYLATLVVPHWIAYEQFRDEMKSDARFGATLPDSGIRIRLVAEADTLGLPPEAKRIIIRRRMGRPPTITISAEYSVKVRLPLFGIKLLHFKPSAEEPL